MTENNGTPNDELARKRQERDDATRAEQRLHQLARQALDESVEQLDDATLKALTEARQRAVATAATQRPKFTLLAASSAVAATLLVALIWQQNLDGTSHTELPQLSSLVAESEEVWELDEELLDEMEFYAWLAEQELQQLEQSHAG